MMTVKEVSDISGVSIRSLHHYDKIGLLPATEITAAGYRLYDENALDIFQINLRTLRTVAILLKYYLAHY